MGENVDRVLRVVDELRKRGLSPSRVEASDAYVTVDGLAPIPAPVDRTMPEPSDLRRPPRA